ncbi:uncharacterized protein BCR38DRAFT_477294 [Pseudomassariella vexata]|uniref:SMP-30/Gluconolactonase/LRE-like region domain-containing protein n=1 Tax=Pseudomassariella vexata TaxID=1141098 RepID=A0A1Y2DKF6_9PEZI|nr:uncharacterized protein BCR38DRAFT_477294 [Pseudomassariella vexata]ORY59691.1 hypothetical protein BCR38DRAFT_477294 [Pseudomassariella vexata]
MASYVITGLVLVPLLVTAQGLNGILPISPVDVAINNVTIIASTQVATSPFQVYSEPFLTILGASPSLTVVYNATFPAFHEAGIVTSLEPLTFYSSSNQFDTASLSPASNNKTVVVSRTTFSNTTGWASEIINNNTAPLTLANGGFQFQDGILWAAQGNLSSPAGAALVYLPTNPPPSNTTAATLILNNYMGSPLNSPNDIFVTRKGAVYFTDPQIGFIQNVRPIPTMPSLVYGFVPGSTDIRVVADDIELPNGVTFSPDENTVYITEAGAAVSSDILPAGKSIYAFDVRYNSPNDTIASFVNRRIFAVPSAGIGDGIHCDTNGNVWVGTGDGVDVYGASGRLLGKVLVEGGVANFGFASNGQVLLMAENLLYSLQVDASVQPAVAVGERRG